MSPASVSNFVGDLVAMATAFEKLPQVEADLSEAKTRIEALGQVVTNREESILRLKAEIDAHLSTIRALEVARDDAQFHALEADDRTSRALDFIKATFGNAGSLIQALEPPALPQPIAADTPVPVQAMPEAAPEGVSPGQSEHPLSDAPAMEAASSPHSASSSPDVATMTEPSPPAPEVAPMPTSPIPGAHSSDATTGGASPLADAALTEPGPFSMSPIARPYAGLTYTRAKDELGAAFTWPNKDEWLAGGGSLDNFYA